MNESYDPGTHLLVIGLIVLYWNLIRLWHQPRPPDTNDERHGRAAGEPQELLSASAWQLGSAIAPVPIDPTPAAQADGSTNIGAPAGAFDEKAFLAGAAAAYELIVNANAEEDFEVLHDLLDAQARDDFADAIMARRSRGEKLTFTFIGIKSLEIVRANDEGDLSEITVRFVSEAVVAIFDVNGTVVDGDREKVVELTDEWKFARSLIAADPNWRLVAT